jgi:EAL domain-containing protein (putative c-di-GMP-specific phosphodiesterase class I)
MIKPLNNLNSVLVVDDDPFTLRTTAAVLKRIGFNQVMTVDNVTDATKLITNAELSIELVLSDLNMPGVDGLELLRHFDELAYHGDILLISGEDSQTLKMAESLACARGLSVIGSMEKPLRTEVLLEILSRDSSCAKTPRKTTTENAKITSEMLESAIDSCELKPWFQPKISIVSLMPVGTEVLARWPGSAYGDVFPDTFIPIAEKYGLIDKLTFSLIEQTIKLDRAWRQLGIELELAFNISMNSLQNVEFPDIIEKRIIEAGGNLTHLKLEVTETQLRKDLVHPLETLLRLRMKRIKLSIDDFGTGHSNLEQLRDLPFDELKLDRSYVQSAVKEERTSLILESTVEMARKLGLSVVAEGVENLEEWLRVEQLGCDQVQGYFTGKPMPGEEMPDWIASWPAKRLNLFDR